MDRKRSIFFAYEWSTPFTEFYKEIIGDYVHNWDIRYGPNITTLPVLSGKVEKYRYRNKQLFDLFARNINLSSIFIADITSGNPNVMLEVGIAIKLNKNILLVSGTSKEKTPFNVRGVEVEFYSSLPELKRKIKEHIDMFTSIKNMTFERFIPGNYFNIPSGMETSDPQTISDGSVNARSYRIVKLPLKLDKMRDSKIRVEYRIIEHFQDDDWFGFMLRSAEFFGAFEPVNLGSILVNARVNGRTDLTIYPGQSIPRSGVTHGRHDGTAFRKLEIILDNELIRISGDSGHFDYEPLTNMSFGYIYLTCFRSHVEYKNLEILNTDTTSEID